MNILKSIFLLIIFSSSYGQVKTNEQDLIITEAKLKDTKIQKAWENLSDIPKEWIKIEMDEKGYLVYDPCDGSTPSVKIDNQVFIVNSGLEMDSYEFGKYKTVVKNKSFRLEAYDTTYKISFIITGKIFDVERGIVLWTFDGKGWLMIPVENIDGFRKIKNNCPTEKKPELKFFSLKQIKENTSR